MANKKLFYNGFISKLHLGSGGLTKKHSIPPNTNCLFAYFDKDKHIGVNIKLGKDYSSKIGLLENDVYEWSVGCSDRDFKMSVEGTFLDYNLPRHKTHMDYLNFISKYGWKMLYDKRGKFFHYETSIPMSSFNKSKDHKLKIKLGETFGIQTTDSLLEYRDKSILGKFFIGEGFAKELEIK
jgi:hypothetical protein